MAGTLVRPVSLEAQWVSWEVEWSDGSRSKCRVGRNTWAVQDLQVGWLGTRGSVQGNGDREAR